MVKENTYSRWTESRKIQKHIRTQDVGREKNNPLWTVSIWHLYQMRSV